MRKIAIVGAGYVGSSIAYALMLKVQVEEIVFIDVDHRKAEGEALDLLHGIAHIGNCKIHIGDYIDCQNCEIIIITAGTSRHTGQSRLDLANNNMKIAKDIVYGMLPYYKDSIIIIVSNPVDILTYKVAKWINADPGKVFGTGCILDTSRLVFQIAEHVGKPIDQIQAMVVGEHGECQQPLWSNVSVENLPIHEYCETAGILWNDEIKIYIARQVREMGLKIIERKGRTHYGIATCVCYLVNAILNNHSIVVPVSSVLYEAYMGVSDVALSVPCMIDKNGIVQHLEQEWENDEIKKFQQGGYNLFEFLHKS